MLLLVKLLYLVALGDTLASVNILVKKKKEIKIVLESDVNYTFIDTGLDINQESNDDTVIKTNPSIEKDIIKTRSINSKKAKIRYKNRLTGGQNYQGHSSVYE